MGQRPSSIGMAWHPGSTTLNQQPLHQALVRAAGLAQGMSAWSLSSLRSLFFSSTVPFHDDMFPGLEHPSEATWRPQPDPLVLEEISGNFTYSVDRCHCTMAGVLGQASPSFTDRRPKKRLGRLKRRSGGSHVCFTPGRRSCPVKTVICSSARCRVHFG